MRESEGSATTEHSARELILYYDTTESLLHFGRVGGGNDYLASGNGVGSCPLVWGAMVAVVADDSQLAVAPHCSTAPATPVHPCLPLKGKEQEWR